jgi:hypothetical protein
MTSLACLGGHLVSPLVVERHLLDGRGATLPSREIVAVRAGMNALGPASSLRMIVDAAARPLCHLLGFAAPADIESQADAVAATLLTGESARRAASLLVVGWSQPLEPRWRAAIVEARRREAEWCLVFNGLRLAVVDAQRVHVHRHLEIDLEIALDDDRGIATLAAVAGAAALTVRGPGGVPAVRRMIDESDRLSLDVCRSLRTGVLRASREVLRALVERPPRPPIGHAFEQALTIVYRLLFLLFAEARGLVPMWHPVYRGSYSVDSLRRLAERGNAPGLWDAVRAASRLAHAGCRLGTLRVTPFNGRLFAPARTPLAERQDLDDRAARDAVLALATRTAPDGGRRDIDYAGLGVEQLGAVYEALLDYTPRLADVPGSRRGRVDVTLEPGSGARKATGTFYTPQVLTRYLIARALGPLVCGASPDRILGLRVLDPAMGSGAFLVAACDYLARAYEAALVDAGACHPSDLGPLERASIRRTIAERCLYGVDVNPVAVQLARLSLWLATLAADRPLSFLDHHLRTGNSLIGAWISSLRRPPGTRPKQPRVLPLFDDEPASQAIREAVPVRFAIAREPNETLEQVRAKERALARLDREDSMVTRWRRVADLWCAHWFTQDRPTAPLFGALADHILTGRSALPDHFMRPIMERAHGVARRHRFFHWELEFPEVFFDAGGARLASAGFDAVIGNPPWEMLRADATTPDSRDRVRGDTTAALRFARDASVYEASTDGHANQYQLFVERAMSLTRPGGRLALVVPYGLITDHGSAALRRLLFSRCQVEELVGFENRRAVFPIHRSVRFLLISASAGGTTREVACRLGEQDPGVLERADHGDRAAGVRVTTALLERLSGPGLAVPDFRAPIDVVIAERAATLFAPLGSDDGWHVGFGRELNATDDRPHFSESDHGLAVIEGKLIEPFVVRTSEARWRMPARAATRLLGVRHTRPRLGYRDVASATNRVTLIAAILPRGCVSTHTVFCLRTPLPLRAQRFLCGLFNSLVVNYLARLRVTTHVTTAIVERLPIPTEAQAGPAFHEVAALARRLARDPDVSCWVRLQALVAGLYQLTQDEFAHILGTFPLIPHEERDLARQVHAARSARRP